MELLFAAAISFALATAMDALKKKLRHMAVVQKN